MKVDWIMWLHKQYRVSVAARGLSEKKNIPHLCLIISEIRWLKHSNNHIYEQQIDLKKVKESYIYIQCNGNSPLKNDNLITRRNVAL